MLGSCTMITSCQCVGSHLLYFSCVQFFQFFQFDLIKEGLSHPVLLYLTPFLIKSRDGLPLHERASCEPHYSEKEGGLSIFPKFLIITDVNTQDPSLR
jgi:hypothetical protein